MSLARALVAQAEAREKAGDDDGALAACRRALQVSPNEQTALNMQATIRKRKEELVRARTERLQHRVLRSIGLAAALLGVVSFIFPEMPDSFRYGLLAVAGGSAAYLIFRKYEPLNPWAGAYRANARVFGYKYEKLDIRAVMGEDGSATVSRTVKVVSTWSELSEVQHYLMVPGSKEDLEEPPSLTAKLISYDDPLRRLAIEKKNGKRKATLGQLIAVKIEPPLGRHQNVEYTLKETAPPGTLALATDQLPDGLEYEFFAWEVRRPTKELLLEIKIPISVGTQRQGFDVWPGIEFGPSTFVPEFKRVTSGWRREIQIIRGRDYIVCTLVVPYPILGMRYVITWIPKGFRDAELRTPRGDHDAEM